MVAGKYVVDVFVPFVWIMFTQFLKCRRGICGILLVFHNLEVTWGERHDQCLVVGGHCLLIGS